MDFDGKQPPHTPDPELRERKRAWLLAFGSLFSLSLGCIATVYTLLALQGVPYDGINDIPTWMIAAGLWSILILVVTFFRDLWESVGRTDE